MPTPPASCGGASAVNRSSAGGASYVNRAGEKEATYATDITAGTRGSTSTRPPMTPRHVELLDELGIFAQIMYSNTLGFAAPAPVANL